MYCCTFLFSVVNCVVFLRDWNGNVVNFQNVSVSYWEFRLDIPCSCSTVELIFYEIFVLMEGPVQWCSH